MRRRWRVVLATLCVETVAAVAVFFYGGLSLVAVAVIYWIDLAFAMGWAVTRHLVGGETTVVQLPRALPQFRLLKYSALHVYKPPSEWMKKLSISFISPSRSRSGWSRTQEKRL